MAKFALLLPREEMVEPAGRIAQELGMEVVMNRSVSTKNILEHAQACRALGADILVARGRQASILKQSIDLPVVEIRLTGLEIALLLHRAKGLVPRVARPKIGIVTIPNMVGETQGFEEVLGIELRTYFVTGVEDTERGVEQAVADGMDVILGGDVANACCRRMGKRTLFLESTEDSLRTSLGNARSVGLASDAERRNTVHLQVLLDYSFNGIIELDDKGVVTQCNDMACKILTRDREQLVGIPLSDLMPTEDQEMWLDALTHSQELYFSVLTVAGVHVVANAAPVTDRGAAEGMIFSFYEMQKMERRGERALRERYRLQRYLAHGRFEDVNHTSREMTRVIRLARTFAGTTQPIFLRGEVGSGKSLFAQSIHNASPCARGPFVTFDCGASWDNQQRSLLQAAREANSGTLYLDHLEDLEQGGQHALCRLLREGVIHLAGEGTPQPVSVRVIVSTARQDVLRRADRDFLPELAYLLAPHQLDLPPLRSRQEDLEQAIAMCLDDCVTKLDRYVVLTKEARKVLMSYPWPGNYIQLHTFLERMALTAPSRTVKDSYVRDLLERLYPDDIPVPHQEEPHTSEEAAQIIAALSRCGGNRAEAALQLGMSKTTLWRRMKQFGIRDRY